MKDRFGSSVEVGDRVIYPSITGGNLTVGCLLTGTVIRCLPDGVGIRTGCNGYVRRSRDQIIKNNGGYYRALEDIAGELGLYVPPNDEALAKSMIKEKIEELLEV